MDIFGIFKRAWEITWKYKGLWVLGILANCSGGNGGGSGNAGRNVEYRLSGDDFPQFQQWVDSVPDEAWTSIGIGIAVALLLLALLVLVLSTIGNGGLIAGFGMADSNQPVTLGRAFREGGKFFWKLLAIQVIPVILSLLLIVPLFIGSATVGVLTAGVGLLCLAPLLCLIVPAGILVTIYIQLTQIALVNDDLSIGQAFSRAWELVRAQPGNILIMALVLGIGNFIAGLALAAPFFLMAIPFLISAVGSADAASVANFSTLLIGSLVYLPILILLSGILRTFITGTWTLTYREMTTASELQVS